MWTKKRIGGRIKEKLQKFNINFYPLLEDLPLLLHSPPLPLKFLSKHEVEEGFFSLNLIG